MINFRWQLAVFLLALAPRLADLASKAFYSDEVTTARRAALPLVALVHDSFAWHQTPVYFLLVAPLSHMPDAQFWLRLPSAILGALDVVLVFSIAARAGGITSGIVAALIIGLAPTEIDYSQEARSYMLMIFCLLVALQALITLAQSGERAALPWRASGQASIWLQFIAGSAAALCTLGDALPWLLASGMTALIMVLRTQNRSGMLRNFFVADLICLTCCVPLYLIMRSISGTVIHVNMPVPMPALIWYDIESVYLMRVCDFVSPHFMTVPTPLAVPICIGTALVVAALGGIWRLRRDPMVAAAILPAALTLPVFVGVFLMWKPLLTARYLLWGAPPFAILCGIGAAALLENCRPVIRSGVLTAIALLLLINLMPYYSVETRPRWDVAAQIFASHAEPRDVAYYCNPGAEKIMRYYLPGKSQPYLLRNFADDLQDAEQARAQGKRVWAIYGDEWDSRPWKSLADFKTILAPMGTPSAEIHAGGRIIMWVYDPIKE
jgi:mannosyltransferase